MTDKKIDNNIVDDLNNLLENINNNLIKYSTNKQLILEDINRALQLFINNYNGALTYNITPFEKICKSVIALGGNYKSLLLAYLKEYTTILTVDKSFLKVTTSEYICKLSKTDNKLHKYYTIAFKDNFNNSIKWYNKIEKETTKTKQEKTIKQLNKSLQNCIDSLTLANSDSFKYFDIVKTIQDLQKIVDDNNKKLEQENNN